MKRRCFVASMPMFAPLQRSQFPGSASKTHIAEISLAYSENASEISAMCVFDALPGNWDRWSGANIGIDATKHLLFIDNDGAFYDPVPQGPYRAQLDRL